MHVHSLIQRRLVNDDDHGSVLLRHGDGMLDVAEFDTVMDAPRRRQQQDYGRTWFHIPPNAMGDPRNCNAASAARCIVRSRPGAIKRPSEATLTLQARRRSVTISLKDSTHCARVPRRPLVARPRLLRC